MSVSGGVACRSRSFPAKCFGVLCDSVYNQRTDTNPQLMDLEDLIRRVLLRYDPAARLTRPEMFVDEYGPVAREILEHLRLVSPHSFLEVRKIVEDVLYPLDAAAPHRELPGKERVRATAEEIWQAWAFYGLQD